MKMNLKLLVVSFLVVVLMVSLSFVGCKTTTAAATTSTEVTTAAATTTTAANKPKTIGFVMIGGTIEHCHIFDQAIRDVAEPKGDKVITLDAVIDITKMNTAVEDLIASQVDAIIIEGLDQEAHIGVIKEANAAGIIVVQSDNWCKDESITVGQAASDNVMAGYMGGLDAIKKLAGEKGKAIVLDNPGSPAATDRVNGFIKGFVTEGGMEIVAQQKAGGVEMGATVTEALIQGHPEVNVLFANHDPAAQGAVAALKSANMLKDVLVYGVDGEPAVLAFIKDGVMAGTAKQDPYTMGKVSCEFLYHKWAGDDYEKKIVIPVVFINQDNVDEFLK